ncbi:hypothetical protein ABT246_10745 [Streptomyces sp. NPDC001553]|uniref:hypothetical protein n=1 Tax=Streptomyces sp. NPDC001553 TaxID=3154385 RepID=UPI0033233470
MSGPSLREMQAPLLVLGVFAGHFWHLPAPTVSVSNVFPDQLDLDFFDAPADFEAWREALGIDPQSISTPVQLSKGNRVLTVEAEWGGAQLRLRSFTRVPASVEERSPAEVAS